VVDLLYFVLLVGALVLVHELGHFAVARAFGVKVLTFSLGFGPTLLSIRGKETTFRVGLLPFGGFVKLLEDPTLRPTLLRGRRAKAGRDRREDRAPDSRRAARETTGDPEIPEADRHRTFQAQSLGARALIALAGPAMNVIVPLFLFFAVFLDAGKVVAPVVGVVVPGSPADGALRAGDRVLAVDGREVATYAEVQDAIAKAPGRKLTLRIARVVEGAPVAGKPKEEVLEVAVTPKPVTEARAFDGAETVGRLGIGPSPLAAVIGVPDPGSPAFRAGLRTFDVVTHVGGVPTPRFVDLARALRDNGGVAVPISYLRPSPIAWPEPSSGALLELAVYDAHVAVLAPEPPTATPVEGLTRAGIENADLYVASVPEGSSEWRAGLRPGDRIVSVDAKPVRSWQAFAEDLVAGEDRTREVTWTREGKPLTGLLRVRKEEWTDASGEHVERYVWRSTHWMPTLPQALVDDPSMIGNAVRASFAETANVMRFIVTGAVRLAQGKLKVEAISGPITIYDVAGRAGARGARDFIWVMALVSINLGLLNLLPIPTLDGGQILFLVIEGATRKPVPLRVREVMSIAGLAMLAVLMVVALRNDVGRHWESLVGPVRHLFG
jgi:regulator of sigma E protease